jgi:DNA replication protein
MIRDTRLNDELDAIRIPRDYFESHLSTASSFDELHTLLAVIRIQASRPGLNAPVEEESIIGDRRLSAVLGTTSVAQSSTSRIMRALNQAVIRGALIREPVESDSRQSIVYRRAGEPESIGGGGDATVDALDGHGSRDSVERNEQAASVYAAYEDNIGLLTPLIADQIRLALELYPSSWIHEAINDAVAYNRRQWRYIQRVLQNWSADGRISGPAHEVNHATNRRGPARAIDTD